MDPDFITTGEASRLAANLEDKGFAFAAAPAQGPGPTAMELLGRAFAEGLELDPNPGRRWRAYGQVELSQPGFAITALPAAAYAQPIAYNPDDGGKARIFRPIAPEALTCDAIRFQVARTAILAGKLYPDVAKRESVTAGVHLVSYRPCPGDAAFSSPMGPHRDVERLVGVTLVGVTGNLGGGFNLLYPGERQVTVVDMTSPLDTLFLTRAGLHAVAPMFARDDRPARRDIILTTIN